MALSFYKLAMVTCLSLLLINVSLPSFAEAICKASEI